ncbi:Na/Pi symporter [Seohaeicola zhoushanensis]
MSTLVVFFQIGGAVALLLFGLGLVRDGITAAFGLRLKTALGVGTRTGPRAFVSGLVATLGLQSSTATALLTASFLDRQLIGARMSQIVLLGANVGTAVTALIISTGIEALASALVLVGLIAYRRKDTTAGGVGKALVGVGLMLISLTLLGEGRNRCASRRRSAPSSGCSIPPGWWRCSSRPESRHSVPPRWRR